jgi:hypothetical protein
MIIEMNFIAGVMLGFELVEAESEDGGLTKCVVVDLFFLRFMCFYE